MSTPARKRLARTLRGDEQTAFSVELVYEPDQFFLPHQDSEKDDSMIGTLVVTLPSRFTGETEALFTGELQARERDETGLDWLTAQWSPDA
jgi:hypothetical protein